MDYKEFYGCHLPIITPFKDDYSVDYDGLKRLVDYYIDEIGVDGIVPCGTTGESPTLTNDEHDKVILTVVEAVSQRVPVMAGTGSNSTKEAIERTKHAEAVGADASLQVGPYYNKPTQDGLRAHYEAIAKETDIPLIIYNIPARTGKNIEPGTIIELSKIKNIIGLKDAAGDLSQTMEILSANRKRDDKFYHLSGEDPLTFTMMALGGDGAIAAVSHVIGSEIVSMCRYMRDGDISAAKEIHYRTLDIIKVLFIESNPVPVKEALAMMGLPAGPSRLPLVPMQKNNREKLRNALEALGKI